MGPTRRMRLSLRIALAVGTAVPLLVLSAGWLLVRLVASDLHTQQDTHLRQRAVAVSRNARGLLQAIAADRSPAVERSRERRLYNSALDVGIRLIGPAGTASGGPQPSASVPLPEAAPEPITVRDGDARWRAMSVRITGLYEGVDGTLWLFSPDTAGDEQLRLVRARVLGVAGVTAPLAGLLAGVLVTRATRPLERLQQRTSGLDPRSTATRLEHTPTGVVEVDDLARTLQTVLARYDEQAARTAEGLATARSFSAAASHELRTPLMSMRTNVDILTSHPDLPPEEKNEVLEDLTREHERLLGLLMMLREMGRGDLVETEAFGPVDLGDVVEASVADLRRRRPDASIELAGEAVPALHGWEPGLRTVIDNLLANAVLHGREGTQPARVAVAFGPAAGSRGRQEAVLTVDDRGPGIPHDAREDVFGRFNRGPDSPGSGLGLTLVAQQVALHRGQVRVLDGPGGTGTRFEVRFPVGTTEQQVLEERADGRRGVRRRSSAARGAAGSPVAVRTGTGGPGFGPEAPPRRDWMIETAAHPRPGERSSEDGHPQSFHKEGS
ncbi:sensor histidine kinase [Streptomyces sp. NPDC058872]|uniref:sensor histidine kinase n=1 Tax=Streptomyces sp. NPDC058872 TaxID=3346661 RepID=UPI0036B02920